MRIVPFSSGSLSVPSVLWLTPGADGTIEFSLNRPTAPAACITDIKGWAVAGQPHSFQATIEGRTLSVSIERAMTEFMRLVLTRAQLRREFDQDFWFLLPPLDDDATKRRYQTLLGRAVTPSLPHGARPSFMSEADAAAEYFRLIDGRIRLRKGRNNAIFVMDCGALTCNMTVAFSTRRGDFGDVETGEGQKRGRLAALGSASLDGVAGRSVDALIWAEMLDALGASAAAVGEEDGIRIAEVLKIYVSRSGGSASVSAPDGRKYQLGTDYLGSVATKLVARYAQLAERLFQSAFARLTRNPDHAASLAADGVTSALDFSKVLSAVVVSGGTSQLPGFVEEVRKRLGIPLEVPILQPGGAYPVVPAIGATARLLEAQGKLTRRRGATSPDFVDAADAGTFLPQLDHDLFLKFEGPRGAGVRKIIDRSRSADLIDGVTVKLDAGMRASGTKFWVCQDVGGKSEVLSEFMGRGYAIPNLGQDPRIVAVLNAQDELVLEFRANGGTTKRSFRVFPYVRRVEPGSATVVARQPDEPGADRAHVEPGNVIVVDFGMSKTLIARCDAAADVHATDFAGVADAVWRTELPAGWLISASVGEKQAAPPEPEPQPGPRPEIGPELMPNPERQQEPEHGPKLYTVPELPPRRQHNEKSRRPLSAPPPIREWLSEAEFLRSTHAQLGGAGLRVDLAELAALHLAAKVRPLVLLAGPPGAGKTTLARAYARAIGLSRESGTWCRVAVEADWTSSEALLAPGAPLAMAIEALSEHRAAVGAVLLDEFNLARPEFYLSRVLSGLEAGGLVEHDRPWPVSDGGQHRLLLIGTLNIDETSKPPSDKVLDRSFLLELDPPSRLPPHLGVVTLQPLSTSIGAEQWARWCEVPRTLAVPPELSPIWDAFEKSGRPQSRHDDLRPSRRALYDIAVFMDYHQRLALPADEFPRHDAIDRAVAGRVLSRIRGDSLVLEPLLNALSSAFSPGTSGAWKRCQRTIDAMVHQKSMGFVSYWGG